MSSAADSLKQPAGEAADEPSSKKAKVSDNSPASEQDKSALDSNNGTAANEKTINLDNNNGTIGGANKNNIANKTPSKAAVNGTDKSEQSKANTGEDGDNVDDDADDDDDDDDDDDENPMGVFDPKIAKSLEQVENIQSEICNLNEKASEEILKVEQKFNKLRRPHFEKRNELLKEIPNFWLTSLANHPIIAPMIESAEDEDCLHYMVNLDVEEFEDIKSGYKLKIHFVENPYITNEVIVKEFHIVSSEEVISSATPIEYKNTPEGRSLKQIVQSSIAEFRRSKRGVIGQAQQCSSFFAWLVEPSESGTDEIAEILKDQIWPNPLEFFFATPEEYGAGTDDDESDDEDEEIDDEDIDDDDIPDDEVPDGVAFSDEELEGEGEADEEEEDEEEEDAE